MNIDFKISLDIWMQFSFITAEELIAQISKISRKNINKIGLMRNEKNITAYYSESNLNEYFEYTEWLNSCQINTIESKEHIKINI